MDLANFKQSTKSGSKDTLATSKSGFKKASNQFI